MRSKLTAALLLSLAVGLLATGSPAVASVSSGSLLAAPLSEIRPLVAPCSNGHVCVWPHVEFKGTVGESLCTGGAHVLAARKESGRNECANKAVWFRNNGFANKCLNPGEQTAAFPVSIEEIWVGAEGSRCS